MQGNNNMVQCNRMHKETLLSMNINSLMLQDTRTHDDNCYRDDGTSTL